MPRQPSEPSKPPEAQPRADAVRNRERILAAAATVFETNQGASLVDIADAAGLSRATAYRHFPDVESVRAALAEEAADVGRELLQERIADLLDDGPDQKPVGAAILAIIETAISLDYRSRAAIVEQPDPDQGLVTTFAPICRGIIRRGQLRGEFRDDLDVDVVAEAAIVLGVYTARRVHRDGVPVDKALSIMETFVRGLARTGRRTDS